jgi:hypothetical protein
MMLPRNAERPVKTRNKWLKITSSEVLQMLGHPASTTFPLLALTGSHVLALTIYC